MTETVGDIDALVGDAVAGDRESVGKLLSLIRPLVVRYCRARVGYGERGFTSADDVAQEVCIAVMTALPQYRDQGRPFMAFVYGIASHKVADAHRSAARNKADAVENLPEEVDVRGGPEEAALEAEFKLRVEGLLNRLGQKSREIITLRVIMGLSAEETAAAIGSTAGAVRVAQHRAMSKLRSILENERQVNGDDFA